MYSRMTGAGLAVALLLAAPAHAAPCGDALDEFDQQVRTEAVYRAALRAGLQRELRQLRQTATLLGRLELHQACVQVVGAMREMVANPDKYSGRTRVGQGLTPAERDQRLRQRLEAAVPVGEAPGPVLVDNLVGSDLRNPQGEDLGDIADVVVDPRTGDISHVLVSKGAFLGLGTERVAIPWDRLRVTQDREAYVLNMSESQLEQAPTLQRDESAPLGDENWLKENRAFYERASQRNAED